MLGMHKLLMRMFGRPKGVLGRLGGVIMARVNRDAAAQVIEVLDVRPDDKVLEVGFQGMSTSRLRCDRAEELRPVHDSRLRKASSGERLRNALLWLTGVDSEAKRDVAIMFEHAPYLPRPGARIRPRLHRIDRERLIERLVCER
jgi:hypothetical protein